MQRLTELQRLIVRHAGTGRAEALISGLSLNNVPMPTMPLHSIYEPVLGLVAQGAKRAVLADRVFDYKAGQYLVVSLGLPVIGHITKASKNAPFLAVGLVLKPERVASLPLEAASVEQDHEGILGIGVSQAPEDLLDALVRLLRLLDRPLDIPIMLPMIEREILWLLLCGEQGTLVRQIGLADSRLSRISRAIRWIREHYMESFRIEDLAKLVAMSPTSFHRHFRAATAMSPLQYQKQIRLQAARSRLIVTAEDVASVGLSVGYDSPSQFSREYGRLFGVPPGRDAARFRIMTE
jgi:AraC-like DNA-binding protein